MDNIFRPSHAFPAVEGHESVFHEFIGNQITKDIEKLAEEVWSKFSIRTSTPEEHEALRKDFREKMDKLSPPRRRIIQTFQVIAKRNE